MSRTNLVMNLEVDDESPLRFLLGDDSSVIESLPVASRRDLYNQGWAHLESLNSVKDSLEVVNITRERIKDLYLVVPDNPFRKSYLYSTLPAPRTDTMIFKARESLPHERSEVLLDAHEFSMLRTWCDENEALIRDFRRSNDNEQKRKLHAEVEITLNGLAKSLRDTRGREHSIGGR